MSPWAVTLYTFVLGAAISFAVAGLIKLTFIALRALEARRVAKAEAAASSPAVPPSLGMS